MRLSEAARFGMEHIADLSAARSRWREESAEGDKSAFFVVLRFCV